MIKRMLALEHRFSQLISNVYNKASITNDARSNQNILFCQISRGTIYCAAVEIFDLWLTLQLEFADVYRVSGMTIDSDLTLA